MATLTIELPDDLRRTIDTRAAEGGYAPVEDYLRDFILVNTASDSGAEPISAELEATLLRALDTPLREMTDADWDEKRRALTEKYGRGEAVRPPFMGLRDQAINEVDEIAS